MTSLPPLETADLDHVLAHTLPLWEKLRGERLFLTGGTGFFGCWLLETFIWANERLKLGARAVVLTRDPAAFRLKVPHSANHASITLHQGDVRSFDFPDGDFSCVIHASAESNAQIAAANPLLLFETHASGARRVYDFSVRAKAQAVLFTSSGAVYGKQPADLSHIPESHASGPDALAADPVKAANAGGIWCAELLGNLYAKQHALPLKIARCFTLIGPYLQLNKQFALSCFLRDAFAGGPINVGGDGTALRSYLYAADLAIWLWTILLQAKSGSAYNVGSEALLSISDLAREVARAAAPGAEIRLGKNPVPGQKPEIYAPDTRKAQIELGLQQTIDLPEALRRTILWHRKAPL